MKYDVAIIGSGISSLTAATILGKFGKSVIVLEQYKKTGGYLHSFKRFNHIYETGSHYVGALDEGKSFHTLLKYLDVYDDDLFIPLDPAGFDVFQFPDFEYHFPKGISAVVETLCEKFPHEAVGVRNFFGEVCDAVKYFPTYNYSLEFDLDRLMPVLNRSLEEVVVQNIRDSKLQAILYGHCALHGVTPKDMAFGLHSLVIHSMIDAPYGFRRTGDDVAAKFVQKIESYGGKVRTAASVTQIKSDDRFAKAVVLSTGEEIEADVVISGIHPKATFRMLSPELQESALAKRLSRASESVAIFGIYADVESLGPISRLKNYYLFESSDPEKVCRINEKDQTPNIVYFSCPEREEVSAEKVPLSFHAAGPMQWFESWSESKTGRRPEGYRALKNQIAENTLKFVATRFPDLRILRYESSSPLTNLYYNGSEAGSGYGIYHSRDWTGMRALGPRTRLKNLFLTGHSTLMPGLLGAATSGVRTAGELVGLPKLLEDLIATRDQ